jgi:hypothetical protein
LIQAEKVVKLVGLVQGVFPCCCRHPPQKWNGIGSGESAGGGTLSQSNMKPDTLPLSFNEDSGSEVKAMNAAVQTLFQLQTKSVSVDLRKGVIKGSAHRIVAMVISTFFLSSVLSRLINASFIVHICTSTDETESVGETYVESMSSSSKNPNLPCSGLTRPLLLHHPSRITLICAPFLNDIFLSVL